MTEQKNTPADTAEQDFEARKERQIEDYQRIQQQQLKKKKDAESEQQQQQAETKKKEDKKAEELTAGQKAGVARGGLDGGAHLGYNVQAIHDRKKQEQQAEEQHQEQQAQNQQQPQQQQNQQQNQQRQNNLNAWGQRGVDTSQQNQQQNQQNQHK